MPQKPVIEYQGGWRGEVTSKIRILNVRNQWASIKKQQDPKSQKPAAEYQETTQC